MKHVFRQWLAGLLSVVLLFTLLPASALAEEADGATGQTAVEQVQALIDELPDAEEITAETRDDVQAQIDAIDAAMAELSGDEAAELDTARYDEAAAGLLALDAPSALEQVQALIDALPDADTITADNRADVEAQLTAIDEAKQDLTDDELDELDVTRYMAAVEAILALDDMTGADVPKTIEGGIKYMDWDKGQKKLVDKTYEGQATKVESNTKTLNAGWYYVEGRVTVGERIEVNGEVHLILMDGCALVANDGIQVLDGNSLTIYGQSAQTGSLSAITEYATHAGIGGERSKKAGDITINGGNVTAQGVSSGAGIGGGDGRGGTIIISGGNVAATGGNMAAGIGGGTSTSGTITINGGSVTATGGNYGAGIGSGMYGGAATITISGGSVTATGGQKAAGIGGGDGGGGGTITISGGSVTATGGQGAAGIGNGVNGANASFSTDTDGNAVIVTTRITGTSQQNSWSGIIIAGDTGKVYGTPTPKYSFEIPSGKTLNVEDGHPLHIAKGITMTNKGTINIGTESDMNAVLNNEGAIINEGTIDVWGQLTNGEIGIQNQGSGRIVYHFNLDVKAPTFAEAKYGSQPPAQTITIKNNGQVDATITDVKVDEGDFVLNSGKKEQLTPGTSDTSWTIQPKTNLPVGTHTATITVTYSGSGSGTSRTATAEVSFTVTKATSTVTVSASGDPTYGSDITLTAEVTTTNGVASNEINGEVTFKAGTVELGKTQADNGTATLEIQGTDTDKQKAIFDNSTQITAEYAGNNSIEESTGTGTVTVKPKTLTYTVTAEGREYDGGETVEVTLTPGGLVGSDVVTLTATGTLSSADAGTYETVNLSDITKDGADKKYYSVEGAAEGKELQGGGVTIKPLVVKIEWKLDGGKTFTVDYTGEAHIATAEVSNKALPSDEVNVTVEVTPDSGAEATDAIAAGSYTATATGLTGAASNNYTLDGSADTEQRFTIQKVAASGTTEPAANNDLTYSGTEQALVTEGSTTGGTVMYALGDKSQAPAEYSDTVPTGTNAGTYYVWWKVVGDANHNDTEPKPITVTIDKAEGTGSVTMGNYLCKQEGVEPEPKSDTNGTASVKYTYTERGKEDPLPDKPTTAGEYTVTAEFAETENYKSFTEAADFTIYHHFDGWEAQDDGYQNTCPCKTGVRLQETEFNTAPDSLKNIEGLQTVEDIKKALVEEVRKDTSIPETNTAVYDVKLQIKSGGSDWEDVDEKNFPEDGITVILPYPEGTNSSYTFTVIHMFTTGDVGQTEKPEPTNGEDGISFTVTSLSPICVGWTAPPSSSSSYYNVTIPSDFEGGSVTSDRTSVRSGSKVTLTVKPDEGYHFGSLTVTNRNGKPVELTDNGDGTYTFTMPYSQVTVDAEFVKCGSLDFTDLDAGAWYHDYTDYVIAHGLMQGTGGGLFAPDGTVNRAQMVTVLWNMSGKPVVNYYMTYSDVSEEAWYTEAIRWATSEGIAAGYGGGLFGPNDPISREQMAAMMYRYEQKYGDGGFTGDWMYRLPFTDLDQISDWAFESVAWCNMKGVMSGKDDDIFDPKGPAKRSELAAILTRYCGEETDEE